LKLDVLHTARFVAAREELFFMLRAAPILGGTGGFACHGRFGCG
jgi:hypothetical protein